MDIKDIVIILLVAIGVALFLSLILVGYYYQQRDVNRCNAMPSCEKYNCLANLDETHLAETNHLIRYQNCLIEQGANK